MYGSMWRSTIGIFKGEYHLEGHGDLVSGLIIGITRVPIWVIGRYRGH